MKITRSLIGLFAMLTLVACASPNLTRSAPVQPARAPHCSFEVLTASVPSGYSEIATIDITNHGWGGEPSTAGQLKAMVSDQVCEAGGDAVLALANGSGQYVKATVLKRTGAPTAQKVPAAGEVGAAGCRFDTQCKGDRICVKGDCVDPAPKSPAQ